MLLSTSLFFAHFSTFWIPLSSVSAVSLIQMRTLLHFCVPAPWVVPEIWQLLPSEYAPLPRPSPGPDLLVAWDVERDECTTEHGMKTATFEVKQLRATSLWFHIIWVKCIETPWNNGFTRTWLAHGWGKPTSKQVGRVASKSPDEKGLRAGGGCSAHSLFGAATFFVL